MIAVMSNFEQNHRIRQRVLLAVALVGLGLLFLTFLTAGGPARAETVAETGGETVTGASAQAQTGGLDEREALAAASAYLSSLENMQGDFSPAQRYPLASTPLNLLLGEDVDLAESSRVLNVETRPGALLITLADRSGEAPGQITLIFDRPKLQLRQWVVTDVQGLQTTVALRNIERGIRADNSLFVLRDEQRPRIGPR